MAPKAHHCPPGRCQKLCRLDVTATVCIDLGRPVVDVGSRASIMLRATVPETAVNKNCNFYSGKNQVCRSTQGRNRPSINEIPKAV